MTHIFKVILPILMCVSFASCKDNAKSEVPQSQTAKTEVKDTVKTDTTNATKLKITKEMAFEGVNNYCHKSYDWSVAKDNPSIMYVEMGEETETEYQVNFRSYTGAFVYFHVNKTTGKTRMVEHVPAIGLTEEAGNFDLLEYIKKEMMVTISTSDLTGTKWQSKYHYDRNAKDYYEFRKGEKIWHQEDGDTFTYKFYLTDKIPTEFDFSKVGKFSKGRYYVEYNTKGEFFFYFSILYFNKKEGKMVKRLENPNVIGGTYGKDTLIMIPNGK